MFAVVAPLVEVLLRRIGMFWIFNIPQDDFTFSYLCKKIKTRGATRSKSRTSKIR